MPFPQNTPPPIMQTPTNERNNNINHNYNKILESDWFLARPIFYQIGARAA